MMPESLETRVTVLEKQMQDVRDGVKWMTRSAITTAFAACGIMFGIIFQVMHNR